MSAGTLVACDAARTTAFTKCGWSVATILATVRPGSVPEQHGGSYAVSVDHGRGVVG
jgi:hypothetical protein